jgi:hypothetical protein
MAHWLLREEGLFVGSSSAMNVVAACRVARTLPEGSVIVTGGWVIAGRTRPDTDRCACLFCTITPPLTPFTPLSHAHTM